MGQAPNRAVPAYNKYIILCMAVIHFGHTFLLAVMRALNIGLILLKG